MFTSSIKLSRVLSVILLSACDHTETTEVSRSTEVTLEVVGTEPSDPAVSTQCLMFDLEGALWMTSGDYERSSLIKAARPPSVEARSTLIENLFAEGCAAYNERVFVLTWRARILLSFERETLTPLDSLPLPHEGWGLTRADAGGLVYVYSDGSSSLRWFDPELSISSGSLKVTRVASVQDGERPVYQLNELEWFEGYLLANHYPHDRIAVIDLESARVRLWIELSRLRELEPRRARELNGIAYERRTDRIWVTGKNWSRRYALDAERLRALLK